MTSLKAFHKLHIVVQLLSHVWLFVAPWTAAPQASLFFTISWSLLKVRSVESVMPSNQLIFCQRLLLLSSFFPRKLYMIILNFLVLISDSFPNLYILPHGLWLMLISFSKPPFNSPPYSLPGRHHWLRETSFLDQSEYEALHPGTTIVNINSTLSENRVTSGSVSIQLSLCQLLLPQIKTFNQGLRFGPTVYFQLPPPPQQLLDLLDNSMTVFTWVSFPHHFVCNEF